MKRQSFTQELRDRMVEGCEEMAGGRDFTTLSREMNAGLVAIAKALKSKARKDGI